MKKFFTTHFHSCLKTGKSRQSPSGNQSGFTLLEIIIVMLIVGMMAVLIAPAVRSGIDSIRFRTSIRQLVSTLRYSRSKAISTKENVVVEIDFAKGSYRILGIKLPDEEDEKRSPTGALPDGAFFTEWETTYVSENDGVQAITFYPKGNATGGTLRIEDRHGKPLEILINRITGRVKAINPDE